MLKNFKEKLSSNYKINNSILCIGLDPDLNLMPVSDITKFNKIIIDSTKNFACAYKPNLSFYEALGSLGIKALENTIDYIRQTAPDKLIIGDGNLKNNLVDKYIKTELLKVRKLGKNRFELSAGPYFSINTLKSDYFTLNKYGFEDLDIKQND